MPSLAAAINPDPTAPPSNGLRESDETTGVDDALEARDVGGRGFWCAVGGVLDGGGLAQLVASHGHVERDAGRCCQLTQLRRGTGHDRQASLGHEAGLKQRGFGGGRGGGQELQAWKASPPYERATQVLDLLGRGLCAFIRHGVVAERAVIIGIKGG